ALARIPAPPAPVQIDEPDSTFEPTVKVKPHKAPTELSDQTEPRAVLFPDGGGAPRAVDPSLQAANLRADHDAVTPAATQRKRPPRPQPRRAPMSVAMSDS